MDNWRIHRDANKQPSIPPKPDSLVFPSATHGIGTRRPVDRVYLILMSRQVPGEFTPSNVPDLQSGIARRRDKKPRVCRESALEDWRNIWRKCQGIVRN